MSSAQSLPNGFPACGAETECLFQRSAAIRAGGRQAKTGFACLAGDRAAPPACQERSPLPHRNKGYEEKGQIMVRPPEIALIEPAGRAHPGLPVEVLGSGLNAGNEDTHVSMVARPGT